MAFSDFKGTNDILNWSLDLDQKWPERTRIRPVIVKTILNYFQSSKWQKIHLLELGPGTGQLAQSILSRLAYNFSTISYTGIDINAKLIHHTEQKLLDLGLTDLSCHRANLNEKSWCKGLPHFNLAYSFQILHDLDGYQSLERVYKKLYSLIQSGGLLLTADFIVPFETQNPKKPRRFPIEVHNRLLESIGFVNFRTESKIGKLAIMTAIRL